MLDSTASAPFAHRVHRGLAVFAVGLCLLLLVALAEREAIAQDAAAEAALAQLAEQPSPQPADPPTRAGGTYLSVAWLLLIIVSVGAWLYGTAWVCDDAKGVGLAGERWTSMMLGAGLFGILWVFLLHAAFVFLLLAGAGATFALYMRERNRNVPEEFKLFSKRHAQKLATKLPHRKEVAEERERLQIKVANQDGRLLTDFAAEQPELGEAAVVLTDLIARASLCRARIVRLERAAEGYVARFNMDGVWHNVDALEPELGQSVLTMIARFAGLQGKGRAVGQIVASLPGEEEVEVMVRGIKTGAGAAVVISLPDWTRDIYRGGLSAVGMHSVMADKVKKALTQPGGAILVSSPRAGGRTMTLHALVTEVDIYTTDVVALEKKAEHELSQVVRHEVDVTSAEAFQGVFEAVVREEPDVIAVDGLAGGPQGRSLLEYVAGGGRALATVEAAGSVEAVLNVLAVVEADLVSRALGCVLNQCLVRKLCEHCKEPVEPSPSLLTKLGINLKQPGTWFRPVGCERCMKTGYLGRTALFEMLIFNEQVRELIAGGGATAKAIKSAAGKAALRTLRQDGILKVRQGITTVQEMRRVLR